MEKMSTRQSILLSLTILALFTLLFFIIFGDNGFVDFNLLKSKKDHLIQKNKEITRENLSLYREIDRLQHDPGFLENVARQELGVIGKDEVIFKIKQRSNSAFKKLRKHKEGKND